MEKKMKVAWALIDDAGNVYGDVEWAEMDELDIVNKVMGGANTCALVHYADIEKGVDNMHGTREQFESNPHLYGCACYKKGNRYQWD